ncbi:hypothetical protein HRR99_05865 [Agrobacterium vaccinii]|uniref:hypothetical protein n=1 Tax=Agrobacterium vaccinii TaxID=2735528 RepID=UPI001E2F26CF|nr:hypothetical protein [Agrobacterium vaccinii]UHS61074.1 hypothetical protein HRR99_05865 [Agrobacterium vaccinii]
MNEAEDLVHDAMKRVEILHSLIEAMQKNVGALMKFVPDGVTAGEQLVLYQSFEVMAIMRDLVATIEEANS